LGLSSESALRIVTFGDLGAGVWGVCWGLGDQAFAVHSQAASAPAVLGTGDETGAWTIGADGLELRVFPLGQIVPNELLDGFDQLGRISGEASVDGGAIKVDGLCRRSLRGAGLDGAQSIRDVSCWFEPDRGLALTAVRPRKSKGHDRDRVAAAVLDVEAEHEVIDPRLSTTYTGDGRPARAGLELWLTEEEEGEQQYPVRAAGELAGAGTDCSGAGLEVLAEPFRWHSRGADGAGVYLLMRPR
jgi:hypothetical protein